MLTLDFINTVAFAGLVLFVGHFVRRLAPFLSRYNVPAPVIGGLLATRIGEAAVAVTGLVIAAGGYLLIAHWPVGLDISLDVELVITGLGLGLVIAPLSAAVLRVVPATSHGVASASVVVARMAGMLIGVSALSAWGFHRFHGLTANLNTPLPFGMSSEQFHRAVDAYAAAVKQALLTEYREIFLATAVICVAGAVLAVFVGSGVVRGRRDGQRGGRSTDRLTGRSTGTGSRSAATSG